MEEQVNEKLEETVEETIEEVIEEPIPVEETKLLILKLHSTDQNDFETTQPHLGKNNKRVEFATNF